MSLTVENFKEKAPLFLLSHLANGRNVLIDAPPGLGKTRSAAKVAISLLNEKKKRVVIIEPTRTLRDQIFNYIKDEDKNVKVHVSKGWNDYKCPLINTSADPKFCSDRKGQCREERRDCGVLKDIDLTKDCLLYTSDAADE